MKRFVSSVQMPLKGEKGIAYLHQEVLGATRRFLAVLTVFANECVTAQFPRDPRRDQ